MAPVCRSPLLRCFGDGGLTDLNSLAPVKSTAAVCPQCGHKEAFYRQMQLRSADEPMTTFYKCANLSKCGHNWRGD